MLRLGGITIMGRLQRIKILTAVLLTATFPPFLASAQIARSPVAPRRELVESVVREAYDKFNTDTNGKNADHIPYLAKVDSRLFGIAIVTTDNQVLTMGDVSYSFSIPSISKVFTLALAMEEPGPNKVFENIGSEPTGRPFNSPLAVVDRATHSGNPLVNAGAIATTSLISGKDANEKWDKILNFYSKTAGEKLVLIDEVYESEAATNTGNKALSMLLAKYERIYADPFESVDIYTKQCSVGVNAAQLARMGATLANNGINPSTGEQVIKREDIPHILSTMTMAGLYDGSGGWAWHVGLPAKSGVGGAIVAVVPGKGAIAVFAPPLDEAGNSVKAQEVIEYVAQGSLSTEQQARFDPLITGFNPADMYAADHIRRVLQTFPGVFSGIGEFTIHKEFVSATIAGETATLRNPALDKLLDFAAEVGLVVLIHNDMDVPFAKPGTEPAYLSQMKSVLLHHPKTTIIWAHTGMGRVVRPVHGHAAVIEEILKDPQLSHVYFDISGDEVAKYLTATPESIRISADLINRYPDRFLFGTDEVAPSG
jgi:glutaminase